jgi:hypothetical protein
VSTSSPFFTPSPQLGSWQIEPVQTPLEHSAGPLHGPPSAQGAQPPPQSTPLSSPFATSSEHVGEAQLPAEQT